MNALGHHARIFVVYDFTTKALRIPLEALRDYASRYRFIVLGARPEGGEILRDVVLPNLRIADRVLVFTDKPNANVGFELGIAAAWGKPIALVHYCAERPAWLANSSLSSFFVRQVNGPKDIEAVVDHEALWFELAPPQSASGGGEVLFLCPQLHTGEGLRTAADKMAVPAWKAPIAASISLKDVPALCADVAQLVWTISDYPEDADERDGVENTCNAIVAGWFVGLRLRDGSRVAPAAIEANWADIRRLHVLRSADSRAVADVDSLERRFDTLDDYRQLLARVAERKEVHWLPLERLARLGEPGAGLSVAEHVGLLEAASRCLLLVALAYYCHRLRQPKPPTSLASFALSQAIMERLHAPWSANAKQGQTPFDSLHLFEEILLCLREWNCEDPVVLDLIALQRSIENREGGFSGGSRKRERNNKQWRKLCSAQGREPAVAAGICAEWRLMMQAWFRADCWKRLALRVGLVGHRSRDGRDRGAGFDRGSEVFVHAPAHGEPTEFAAAPFVRVEEDGRVLFLGWPDHGVSEQSAFGYTRFEPQPEGADDAALPRVSWVFAELAQRLPWLQARLCRRLERRKSGTRLVYTVDNTGNEELVLHECRERLPPALQALDGETEVVLPALSVPAHRSAVLKRVGLRQLDRQERIILEALWVNGRQGDVTGSIAVTDEGMQAGRAASAVLRCERRIVAKRGTGSGSQSEAVACAGQELQVVLRFENRSDGSVPLRYEESIEGDAQVCVDSVSSDDDGVRIEHQPQEGRFKLIAVAPLEAAGELVVNYTLYARQPGSAAVRGSFDGGPKRSKSALEAPADETLSFSDDGEPRVDVRPSFADEHGPSSHDLFIEVEVHNQGRQLVRNVELVLSGGPAATSSAVAVIERLRGGQHVTKGLRLPADQLGSHPFEVRLRYAGHDDRTRELEVVGGHERWLWRPISQLGGFQGRQEVVEELRLELYGRDRPVFLEAGPGVGKEQLLRHFHLAHPDTRGDRMQLVAMRWRESAASREATLRWFRQQLWESAVRALPDEVRNTSLKRMQAVLAGTTENEVPVELVRASDPQTADTAPLLEESVRTIARYFRSYYQRPLTASGDQKTRVKLMLVITSAASLGRAAAEALRDVYRSLRNSGYSDIFLVLVDSHWPEDLDGVAARVKLRPWTEPEWGTVWQRCFVYPRLSQNCAATLFRLSQGIPVLADALTKTLRKDPTRFLTITDGLADFLPSVSDRDFAQSVHEKVSGDFSGFLVEESLEGHRERIHELLTVAACMDDAVERTDFARVVAEASAPASRSTAATPEPDQLIDALARHGWIQILPGGKVAPPAVTGRREFMASLVPPDRQVHYHGALLRLAVERERWDSAVHQFKLAHAEVRGAVLAQMLQHAESLASSGHPLAETMFGALASEIDRVEPDTRLRIALGAARFAWRKGARGAALAWRDRLGVRPRRPSWIPGAARAAGRELAVFDAWRAVEEGRHKDALQTLRPYLVSRRFWLRDDRLLGAFRDGVEHNLLALEILFFARRAKSFLRLQAKIDALFHRLSQSTQAEYLDALWRITEDSRYRELTASQASSKEAALLARAIDRSVLVERIDEIFTALGDQVPLWYGHRHYRRWQMLWPRRSANASNGEDLLNELDRAIASFRQWQAHDLLARALRDKGDALFEEAAHRGSRGETYLANAYDALREAATLFKTADLRDAYAQVLRTIVKLRVGSGSDVELKAGGEALARDLKELHDLPELDADLREELRGLLARQAYAVGDLAAAQNYVHRGESGRLRTVEYMVARRRADTAFSEPNAAGWQHAHIEFRDCLAIIDSDGSEPDLAARALRPADLAREEVSVLVRLARVCTMLGKNADASGYLERLLSLAARWLRSGDGSTHEPLWRLLETGEQDRDRAVVVLFDRCLELWRLEQGPVRDRLRFFRQNVVQQFGSRPLVAACWRRLREEMPADLVAHEQVDLELLGAEISIAAGTHAATALHGALEPLLELDPDSRDSVAYVVELMKRLVALVLQARENFDGSLNLFERAFGRPKWAAAAVEALASSLILVLEPHGRATKERNKAGQRYYAEYVLRAFALLESVEDGVLSIAAIQHLVRTDLIFRERRDQTLRWMQLWMGRALRSRDASAVRSLISQLCAFLSELQAKDEGALLQLLRDRFVDTLALPPASAEPNEPAKLNQTKSITLCREIVAECLNEDSWLPLDTKLSVLFHVVEKVLGRRERDLQLVTGVYLYRVALAPDSTHLELVKRGWLDGQESVSSDSQNVEVSPLDRKRVGVLLSLGELAYLWPYRGSTPIVSSNMVTNWNLLVSLEQWRGLRQALPSTHVELRYFASLDVAIELGGRRWALTTAAQHLGRWNSLETMDHLEIRLVPMLARYLVPDHNVGTFGDAYLQLQHLVDECRQAGADHPLFSGLLRRTQELGREALRPEEASARLNAFQILSTAFLDKLADQLWSVRAHELLLDASQRLESSLSEGAVAERCFVEPENIAIDWLTREYWRLLPSPSPG